ncbi:MAG: hypothetical protein IID46_09070 [Planctomycetes bacterium]|nr:hypothetical protein [Planctomycetota bacterium]
MGMANEDTEPTPTPAKDPALARAELVAVYTKKKNALNKQSQAIQAELSDLDADHTLAIARITAANA